VADEAAGLLAIEKAKADAVAAAYDSQKSATVQLTSAALDAHRTLITFFLPRQREPLRDPIRSNSEET